MERLLILRSSQQTERIINSLFWLVGTDIWEIISVLFETVNGGGGYFSSWPAQGDTVCIEKYALGGVGEYRNLQFGENIKGEKKGG
jgi:hypothetical protein